MSNINYQQIGLAICEALIDFNVREVGELKNKVKKECDKESDIDLFDLYFKQALDEILSHKIIKIENNQITLDGYSNYSSLRNCLIFKSFKFYSKQNPD